MNQIVDVEKLVSAVPLDKPAVKKMTRREKLLHWARIVRPLKAVRIYHQLEYYGRENHAAAICCPAYDRHYGTPGLFGTALASPVFRAQGLVGTPLSDGMAGVSPRQIMDFFELSQAELHEFSCN